MPDSANEQQRPFESHIDTRIVTFWTHIKLPVSRSCREKTRNKSDRMNQGMNYKNCSQSCVGAVERKTTDPAAGLTAGVRIERGAALPRVTSWT